MYIISQQSFLIGYISMFNCLKDVPVYASRYANLEAKYFNRVRLALLRLNNPLRIELSGLRGMDMLLGDEAWACVDRTTEDLPVLAWVDFQSRGRNNLHRAISCRILYFHCHADMILETALRIMDERLAVRLKTPQ
jgi:hypothetical protein